jgi:chaperonin GroES
MAEVIDLRQDFLENIAETLDEETLTEIGETVVRDYTTDLAARSVWDERSANWYKLFSGIADPKTHPWEGASNIIIPLMSTACLQYQARSYDSLLGDGKEIAKFFPTDGASIDVAKRCQKYMNWQLSEQMEEWIEDTDILLLQQPIYGVAVKKTYYDPMLGRILSRTLRVDEFVAPYGVKRLEDATRMTHRYDSTLNDTKIKGRDKIWINTDDIESAPSRVVKPAEELTVETDKASGTTDSREEKDRPRIILEQHRTWDLDGDGIEEDYIITVDQDSAKVLRIDNRTHDYFTAYNFIHNPESWMGFGFGHLLEHLNHSANALINQITDSGTLSNTISGFYNKRSGLSETGDLGFSMGEFRGVEASSDDLNKSIYQFKFNSPSNVLFALLQMVQGYSRELASVSETMLGKLPPSDTTATSMITVMEQGLKVFSTINKRTYRALKKELKKIAALNAVYLNEVEYFQVQDSTSSEITTLQSGRQDFSSNIDVIPVADPTITSRAEKLIKAKEAYTLGIQDPLIANNLESRYELLKNLYEALEIQNISEILVKPEPQEPPDLRPEQEEAEFLAERAVQPLPTQDHIAHLQSHEAFAQSEWAAQLTPQGKKLLEGHMRETLALFYLAQGGQVDQGGL